MGFRRRSLIAGLLLLAVALSACGDGGETTGSSTPSPGSTAASPTEGATATGGATVSGTGKPACELLSTSDVSSALGEAVGDGKAAGAGGATGATDCEWESTEPSAASLSLSKVQVARASIQPACDATKQGLEVPAIASDERVAGVEEVSGIGDSAFWVAYRNTRGVTAGGVTGQLIVCVTSRAQARLLLTLFIRGADAAREKTAATALATKAVSRL